MFHQCCVCNFGHLTALQKFFTETNLIQANFSRQRINTCCHRVFSLAFLLIFHTCLDQRTTSTEQGALVINAVETLPSRNLSKAPLMLRDPTKIESAFHLRASSTSTRRGSPFLKTAEVLRPIALNSFSAHWTIRLAARAASWMEPLISSAVVGRIPEILSGDVPSSTAIRRTSVSVGHTRLPTARTARSAPVPPSTPIMILGGT